MDENWMGENRMGEDRMGEDSMIGKLLIANRGEIASRIIRTCRRLGIRTVAVYSDADASAPFVKQADEAFPIGGTHVRESYLNMDAILKAAKESGAEAVHPGYGLLSENAEFARRCLEAGLVFVGPAPDAIAMMGSKIASREAMERAGVPIIPGVSRSLEDVEEALEAAETIGYPVMLKASAGGGGVGIQIVRGPDELRQTFESNRKRAAAIFGDGTVYMEKVLANPRHVEIQVLADHHGRVIHLGERECSVQRRHQKIVEEALSPFLDEASRERMGQAAVNAARAISYRNAGTIEFLVDEDKNFYFLEMNTRLQVEHPVTEEITGLDLVEQQIRIACGEPLGLSQEDVRFLGHAIEARIYAEDPRTFFPSPGTVTKLSLPEGPGVRHELAIGEGSVVTPFYDPMIAKLIVHAEDRQTAIERMIRALEEYRIEGLKTNLPLLRGVLAHEAFRQGRATTDFVSQYLAETSAHANR